MRILYFHQHVSLRTGTSGGRPYEFSRIMVSKGHKVTLVCGEYEHFGEPLPRNECTIRRSHDGIDLRVLRVSYGQKMSFTRRVLAFSDYAITAAREATEIKDIDVVLASSTPLTVAIPGILTARRLGVPLVFEVRDLWPEVPIALGVLKNPLAICLARLLENVAYRSAKAIVALSPGMRDWLLAKGIRQDKVSVIPNASDVEMLRRPKEDGMEWRAENPEISDRPLLVYAGSFGLVNDLGYLVRLAAELKAKQSNVLIVLVGQGRQRVMLEELASKLGVLGCNLLFISSVPRHKLGRILSAATALISTVGNCTALENNSANKIFDAFAAGKPLLINYGGWQAELLRETGAGRVLSRNPAMAAQELEGLMNDQEWLSRASLASASLGETKFAREKLAADLERVLESVQKQ